MPPAATPKFAVLVTGANETELRRFLARYVKPAFGMQKNQWRLLYREHYPLTVLSRPLRAGEDPERAYGAYIGSAALIVTALSGGVRGSGREALRTWLAAQGFEPRVELNLGQAEGEFERIDQGTLVANYVNNQCSWRREGIEDIDAYIAKHGDKPFWA